ncbi:sugar ABC transporter substrate-binding protein [Micromonospora sagamiensis]|uniref:Ribose transport system substrate-binding protein n=1 Tax=Micromonospora sagamiensis TaxID=47875 RepID=A0A562WDM9_9ACTN|nr:substrate-binding domain-containing protein [Micromonospora sagamiensis]TWJ28400.1 ribose transport system substrate-binding protein [Micromonospora sagamiensis]BCL12708.1 ABC transporter substrate-binding protein [Micromonospora sagamiensis]
MSNRTRGKTLARSVAALLAVTLAVTACGGGDESGGSGEAADPIAGRPAPTDQAPDSEVKIAMIGFANNPYWVSVKAGADYADRVLGGKKGKVDWIVAGDNIDVQTVSSAIRAADAQGYKGVGFFIAGEGNCADIKTLAAKGIKLGAYNTLFDCVGTSGGTINYAQEQYKAGQTAAQEMIKASGDKAGKVGIIVSQFTAPGSEQRRQGFIDGLKGSKLTPVNQGVEAKDSASNTFSAAQNFLQSSPDLVGIYATAGGPFGAAQAVAAANKQETVKVIGYDITTENIEAIKNGSMYGVIGQDAFGQGYNVAVELFNAAVTGQQPAQVKQEAVAPFVTKDNLAEHDPSTLPLGTPGAS